VRGLLLEREAVRGRLARAEREAAALAAEGAELVGALVAAKVEAAQRSAEGEALRGDLARERRRADGLEAALRARGDAGARESMVA
jgi:hypothetical protein